MAIDSRNKRGSAFQFFLATTLPAASGSIGLGDRATTTHLYSGLPYPAVGILSPAIAFARTPFQVVKLTLAGDIAGSEDFFFVDKEGPPAEQIGIQLGIIARPYLLRFRGRPTKILPDKAVTERSRVTLTFAEDPDGPSFDSTVFTVFDSSGIKESEFWRRLRVAQPDYIGSAIEVRRGFFPVTVPFSSLDLIFKGKVEGMDLQRDGAVSIRAKDILRFRDVNQPAQISNDNLLFVAATSNTNPVVDDSTEFTDPATLPSKDLYPVIVKIEDELIAIRSFSGNTLVVSENYLEKSEEFNDQKWVKTATATVIPNAAVGPFGGLVADEISFPTALDEIAQTTLLGASGDRVFSIWLRSLAADGVTESVTMELASTGIQKVVITAFITNKWKRFEAFRNFTEVGKFVIARLIRGPADTTKFVAFGSQIEIATTRNFYIGTNGNNASIDAGRGAFGTTAVSHAENTVIKEVLVYRGHLDPEVGVHPVFALRDLINRGIVATADVDQTSFDDEFFFVPSSEVKRAGTQIITESKRLSEHIKEVREQALLDLWVSETGLMKTRFSFRQITPGVTTPIFKDEDSIIEDALDIRQNEESRITRAVVYYDPITVGGGSKASDFAKAQIVVDFAVEAASGPSVRRIFASWVFRQTDALALAGRLVARFFRSARVATLALDLKDESLLDVGDTIALNSVDILQKSTNFAVRFDSLWGVTQKTPMRREGQVRVEALEYSGNRQFIIAPSGTPDFDSATTEQKKFGFIGNSNNKVGVELEDGYFIV